ncbi:MAG: hypothetical protein EPO13_06955 [Actinomycetota bacterium]|nr:MAG: hypothetical protein EPO13_06955 [Actinomycetota bacterium]
MRRPTTLLAVWVACALLATGVGLAAVGVVRGAVSDGAVQVLTGTQVDAALRGDAPPPSPLPMVDDRDLRASGAAATDAADGSPSPGPTSGQLTAGPSEPGSGKDHQAAGPGASGPLSGATAASTSAGPAPTPAATAGSPAQSPAGVSPTPTRAFVSPVPTPSQPTSPSASGSSGPGPGQSSGSPTASATPSAPAPAGSATPRTIVLSRTTTQGSVTVSCQGDRPALRTVNPRPGWRLTDRETSASAVRVGFRPQDSDDSRSEVTCRCEGGVPTFRVTDALRWRHARWAAR